MRRISLKYHPISSGAKLLVTLATLVVGARAQGQSSSASATATSTTTLAAELRHALPANVAARILARAAAAEAVGLPGEALEQRALKFAARGVAAAAIEQSIDAQAVRMAQAKQALEHASSHHPTGDEIEAGAEAIREGVDGHLVSALAKSAPSGRSLVVSLYVIGSLTARGLHSDQALARVEAGLLAHASDQDLELMLSTVAQGRNGGVGVGAGLGVGHRNDGNGTPGGGAGVGASGTAGVGVGGAPVGVPGNGGATVTLPIVAHTHN